MNARIRFATLIKRCGKPVNVEDFEEDLDSALIAGRVLTVHHGEHTADRFWGERDWHACNVVGRCVFPKPMGIDENDIVIGVEQHLEQGMI